MVSLNSCSDLSSPNSTISSFSIDSCSSTNQSDWNSPTASTTASLIPPSPTGTGSNNNGGGGLAVGSEVGSIIGAICGALTILLTVLLAVKSSLRRPFIRLLSSHGSQSTVQDTMTVSEVTELSDSTEQPTEVAADKSNSRFELLGSNQQATEIAADRSNTRYELAAQTSAEMEGSPVPSTYYTNKLTHELVKE